jgi:hypothetical protein
MAFRVLFAALIGGALVFAGGAASHMLLHLVDRQMQQPANLQSIKEGVQAHFPSPGVYHFPPCDQNCSMDKETFERLNEEYKKGPSGMVVIAPTGEDMMSGKTLGMEYASNALAALIVAAVVACTRPGIGFGGRWLIVVALGVFTWLSVNASYHIWYRFPQAWVQDELFAALLEWSLAGLAIAAIVRPRERVAGY